MADTLGKHLNDNNRRLQPKRGYLRGKTGADMVRKDIKMQRITPQAAERARATANDRNWIYIAIILAAMVGTYFAFKYVMLWFHWV